MPKKNPLVPSVGAMTRGEVLAGAAQSSQLRTIQAMLAAQPPHAPALAAFEAAKPALQDPQALFTAAGVDRGALESEFKALTGRLADADVATRVDFGQWQFPGHYTRGAYAPVAGASVLEVSAHDALIARDENPGPQEPLRLEIWIVASSWAMAGGIAWSEVDPIHGQIGEIYVGA